MTLEYEKSGSFVSSWFAADILVGSPSMTLQRFGERNSGDGREVPLLPVLHQGLVLLNVEAIPAHPVGP